MEVEWIEVDDVLEANFGFVNFAGALTFVNKVGAVAEEMDHHPDILIHNYKHVRIRTTTHNTGGVTEKDYTLAKKISEMYN